MHTTYQNMNSRCCCFGLRKATRVVTQWFDRHLEPAGIRATQFTLLLELANSSGKTLTDMADGLAMDRTTLTRNLKPLEKLCLIAFVKLPDKRSKGYTLTDAGHKALERGTPLWERAQALFDKELGVERYQKLLGELETVRKIVQNI